MGKAKGAVEETVADPAEVVAGYNFVEAEKGLRVVPDKTDCVCLGIWIT